MQDVAERYENNNAVKYSLGSGASSPPAMRTALTGADSYYRSFAFTTHASINPLIAAASALLVINSRIKHTLEYENTAILYQNLVHEVKAFEIRAQNLGFRTDSILVARYILCACLDEGIMATPWGSEWQNQLLNTFQREENPGERFFVILDRISEDAAHHIELLELAYLCLSQGFEGKYHEHAHGKIKLDNIVDSLYQRIRKQRQELKPLLVSKINTAPEVEINKSKAWLINKYILFTVLIFTLFLFGMEFFLVATTSTISSQLHAISQTLLSIHGN